MTLDRSEPVTAYQLRMTKRKGKKRGPKGLH